MSINVIGKRNDNMLIKCSNCNHEEESHLLDNTVNWNDFNVENPGNAKSEILHVACLKCGHRQPRKSVGFAKLINSSVIHFCQTFEDHLYISRCGVLSSHTTDGKIQIVKEIDQNSNLCKSCVSVEGNMYNSSEWFTKNDILKDTKFKLLGN